MLPTGCHLRTCFLLTSEFLSLGSLTKSCYPHELNPCLSVSYDWTGNYFQNTAVMWPASAYLFSHWPKYKVLLQWLIMMGWDYVSKQRRLTGLLFIPRVICEHVEPWWWWCQLGITPDLSTRALWQSNQQRHLRQGGGMDKGVRILPIQYLRYLKGSLTCCKILRHGTSSFTSHPKEGVLWISIALKNPSPRPGLNLQPLGPVASTLTTTLPTWQVYLVSTRVKWSIVN
jgi:hypothetical protein